MPTTPYVLEFGMGVDVHGQDSTTAARRAVFDAIRHSSLPVLRQIRDGGGEMLVDVLVGVPNPSSVDIDAVKAELPHGIVTGRYTVYLADSSQPDSFGVSWYWYADEPGSGTVPPAFHHTMAPAASRTLSLPSVPQHTCSPLPAVVPRR